MPTVDLKTNVKIDDVGAYILKLSKFSAETLSKPESYMNVIVSQSLPMSFNGSLDPAFQCTIISLGNLNPEANIKYSAAFSKFFEETLKVPNDRGYIAFIDPGRTHLGYD
ncbi:Tautomerase/MIF [Marasmius fiardii PR-910]|nr:Tautomerase/MIF [Marasmius fiardii PR-910]